MTYNLRPRKNINYFDIENPSMNEKTQNVIKKQCKIDEDKNELDIPGSYLEHITYINHLIYHYDNKNINQLMVIFSSSYDLILRYHNTERIKQFTLEMCKKIVKLRYIIKKQNKKYYNILETYLDELMLLI
jgi:hypothetical protein